LRLVQYTVNEPCCHSVIRVNPTVTTMIRALAIHVTGLSPAVRRLRSQSRKRKIFRWAGIFGVSSGQTQRSYLRSQSRPSLQSSVLDRMQRSTQRRRSCRSRDRFWPWRTCTSTAESKLAMSERYRRHPPYHSAATAPTSFASGNTSTVPSG
jgi:hypothetical protein